MYSKRFFIFALALMHLLSGTKCAKRRVDPQKCRVTNFYCVHDPTKVKDVACNFKSTRNIFGIFNIAFTFLKPEHRLWFSIVNYMKNSANLWKEDHIRIKIDLCNFKGSSNKMVVEFVNLLFGSMFDTVLQTCPYKITMLFKGRTEIRNYTLETVNHIAAFMPGVPTGDYRYVFAVLGDNGAKNASIEIILQEYCKFDVLKASWM